MDFSEVAMDASSFARRISWLKFEPKVSNFPVLGATVASSTNATVRSHFYFVRKLMRE